MKIYFAGTISGRGGIDSKAEAFDNYLIKIGMAKRLISYFTLSTEGYGAHFFNLSTSQIKRKDKQNEDILCW